MGPFDKQKHDQSESRPATNDPEDEDFDPVDRNDEDEEWDSEDDEDVEDLEDEAYDEEEEYDDEEEEPLPEQDDRAAQPGPKRRRERRYESDERSDRAYAFLCNVLREMGMDVGVRRRRPRPDSSPDEIHLEIIGRDVGRVIGKKGQVLAALQYLVNRMTNKPGLPRRHVVLDAEGYRHRRETTLATMARRLGEQAVKEGKIITFEPMSPRDRRVVHLALAKFPDVVTKSDGEGEERRVRIIPVRR